MPYELLKGDTIKLSYTMTMDVVNLQGVDLETYNYLKTQGLIVLLTGDDEGDANEISTATREALKCEITQFKKIVKQEMYRQIRLRNDLKYGSFSR